MLKEVLHKQQGQAPTRKKRAPPVTDDSLCPQTGALRHQLEVRRGDHLPTLQSTKGAKCALHNWAGEKLA